MKAADLNFQKDLQFNLDTGMTTFKDNRMVIFDANAIGLLRHQVIEQLGMSKARELFLRFGFQQGYADFMQLKINFDFDSEEELVASGPTLHTWEGVVRSTPTEVRFNPKEGIVYHKATWLNSYEAEQHLSYYDAGAEPVCWSLMGYASGYISAICGFLVIAIETKCRGKGDDCCEGLAQPPAAWGEVAKPYIAALSSLMP